MDELSMIVRNTYRTLHAGLDGYTFGVVTTASLKQQRALDLI